MTIQEFCEKYYLHDSCITRIDYINESKQLEITINFCQWAQEWFTNDKPENIWLKLIFHDVDTYKGITGDIDYFSVLDAEIKDEKLRLFILDDIHDESYEYYLSPSDIEIVNLGVVEE